MGITTSRLDKTLTSLPDGERYFGLENFGNTCYCNSVLQALYFCQPFRDGILKYAASLDKEVEDTVYTCLADLFLQVHNQKKKSGVISPKKFVQRVKRDNDQFCGYMHQDAHEFLNFMLLKISDILEKEERAARGVPASEPVTTWVHEIFQGKLVHETRCLQCETTTSQEEVFMDLHLAIEHNCSLTSCLKKYSAKTTLSKGDKYFCEVCQCKQEAQRGNRIKKLPEILICQLKRFDLRMQKLMDRVVFPMELKLCNTTDDASDCDNVYNLFAVVVHSGSGLNHGHYVSLIKSHGHWLLFDDDQVEPIPDIWVERTFGYPAQDSKNTDRGYILFYEKSASREIRPLPSPPQSVDVVSGDSNSTGSRKLPHKAAGVSEHSSMGRAMSEPLDFDAKNSNGRAAEHALPRGGSELISADSLYKKVTKIGSSIFSMRPSRKRPKWKSLVKKLKPRHRKKGYDKLVDALEPLLKKI
ncbi:hypothetical protein BSKO_11172 [Bryopsis sp. KO-2023]|nr:hypothetical protein BSKO_11172 [Bryopsis sp. KO-2023]